MEGWEGPYRPTYSASVNLSSRAAPQGRTRGNPPGATRTSQLISASKRILNNTKLYNVLAWASSGIQQHIFRALLIY